MTDNSRIVLRWEIDNATARFATGRVVSDVFDEGGFKWTTAVERRGIQMVSKKKKAAVKRSGYSADDKVYLSLLCAANQRGFWKCEVEVDAHLFYFDLDKYNFISKHRFCFEENHDRCQFNGVLKWNSVTHPVFMVNDRVTLEFRIKIISRANREFLADPAKFATSNSRNNVVLKIGNENLNVSAENIDNEAGPTGVNNATLVTDNMSSPIDIETVTSSNKIKNNAPVVSDDESIPIDDVDGTLLNEENNNDENVPIFDITTVSFSSELRKITLGAGATSVPVLVAPHYGVRNVTLSAGDTSTSTAKFASSNEANNVLLIIGEKKLNYLAIHSPVFADLFFGNSVEKGKKEIEIKDIVYEEFLDLLNLIFPGPTKITDDKLVHVLKLASRFQMEGVVKLSEEYLIQSKEFDAATKMRLADKYGLVSIWENWLQSFNNVAEVIEKLSSPEAVDFSEEMKISICNRIMELNLQMTDNSSFVISWVLNNSTSNGSSGKIESEAVDEGGFRWSTAIEKRSTVQKELSDFTLQCEVDHNGSWKCEGEVVVLLKNGGNAIFDSKKSRFCFDEESSKWIFESTLLWAYIVNLTHLVNNKVTVEFRINISSSDRGESIEAKLLNDRCDVTLKFGEKTLPVSREYLAVHSPVFAAMFFGDFAEKGKKEIDIKDVEYEEFLDLLNLIYLGTLKITDRKVLHLLKLADRFQLERVFDLSKDHLIHSKGFDVVTKLSIADQYRLAPLRDHCLQLLTNVTDVHEKLKSSPEYFTFSADMKVAICDRIMQLNLL